MRVAGDHEIALAILDDYEAWLMELGSWAVGREKEALEGARRNLMTREWNPSWAFDKLQPPLPVRFRRRFELRQYVHRLGVSEEVENAAVAALIGGEEALARQLMEDAVAEAENAARAAHVAGARELHQELAPYVRGRR